MTKQSVWVRTVMLSSICMLFATSFAVTNASTDQVIPGGSSNAVFLPLVLRTVPAVRIESGSNSSYTDSKGNIWQADTGAADGEIGDFGNIAIANTSDPRIYQTEHYKLTSYAFPVVNGNYTVRLHFAENFNTAAGARIFTVNVEGTALPNIDVFAEAGGAHIALVKTVSVAVTDGQLNLNFSASAGQTMINGIEILSP